MTERRVGAASISAVAATEGDADCCDFCVRIFRLCAACLQTDRAATAKVFDAWRWQVPEAK